jgi:hypothetical protein
MNESYDVKCAARLYAEHKVGHLPCVYVVRYETKQKQMEECQIHSIYHGVV